MWMSPFMLSKLHLYPDEKISWNNVFTKWCFELPNLFCKQENLCHPFISIRVLFYNGWKICLNQRNLKKKKEKRKERKQENTTRSRRRQEGKKQFISFLKSKRSYNLHGYWITKRDITILCLRYIQPTTLNSVLLLVVCSTFTCFVRLVLRMLHDHWICLCLDLSDYTTATQIVLHILECNCSWLSLWFWY